MKTATMNTSTLELTKATLGVIGAGTAYAIDIIANSVSAVPGVFSEYGLPIAFLICVIFALVSTTKALRQSESGRLEDRDKFADQLRSMQKEQAELLEKNITAQVELKASMEKQAEALKRVVTE